MSEDKAKSTDTLFIKASTELPGFINILLIGGDHKPCGDVLIVHHSLFTQPSTHLMVSGHRILLKLNGMSHQLFFSSSELKSDDCKIIADINQIIMKARKVEQMQNRKHGFGGPKTDSPGR